MVIRCWQQCFIFKQKTKKRADYVWSKDEELQHLVEVSERFAIQTKVLAKALKEKVVKGEDTQQDWRDFYDSERDMRFYLNQLTSFSMYGIGK